MVNMYCNICKDFPAGINTPQELQKHLKAHSTHRLEENKVPPSVKEDIEKSKANIPPPPPPKPEEPKPLPVPILLTYKFVGQCPTCMREPKTLSIDLGGNTLQVAYCLSCDKKLVELTVFPIEVQLDALRKMAMPKKK